MHTRTNDVGEATTGEDGTEEAPSQEQLAAFRKEVDSAVHNLQCNTCLELKPLRTNMHTHTISTCMQRTHTQSYKYRSHLCSLSYHTNMWGSAAIHVAAFTASL